MVTEYVHEDVVIVVTYELAMPGIDLLFNDLVQGKSNDNIILANKPTTLEEDISVKYPACVVTRAQATKTTLESDDKLQLVYTFMCDPDKLYNTQNKVGLAKGTPVKRS